MEANAFSVIGAPSSAGAYGPGQEKAPDALRAAGLIRLLQLENLEVVDRGNIPGFRWQVDKNDIRAMNVKQAMRVAKDLSPVVKRSLAEQHKVLVLGGDCSIELGCVAGSLELWNKIGLLYIDLDTDLNTPQTVTDGALDWMGVGHLFNLEGSRTELATMGIRLPMLSFSDVCFFASGNYSDFEKNFIEQHKLYEIPIHDVVKDPAGKAREVCKNWATQFERILIHCDVDVLDYVDFQLAENYRRNTGLTLDQLMMVLTEFLSLPNWAVLTVTEINPDHSDPESLQLFASRLAKAIAAGI